MVGSVRARRRPHLGNRVEPRPMSRAWTLVPIATVAVTTLATTDRAHADDVVDVAGTRASGFSSVARERDASREVTDAASLIEPVPGVHVRRFGADDGLPTLSVRRTSS